MCYYVPDKQSRLGSFDHHFSGPVSEVELKTLLVRDGDFLIQEIDKANDLRTKQAIVLETSILAISVMCGSAEQAKVRHWLIKEEDQKFGIVKATFWSISLMTNYFLWSEESIVEDEHILLKRFVSPQTFYVRNYLHAMDTQLDEKSLTKLVNVKPVRSTYADEFLAIGESPSQDPTVTDDVVESNKTVYFTGEMLRLLQTSSSLSTTDATSSLADVTPSMFRSLGLISAANSSNKIDTMIEGSSPCESYVWSSGVTSTDKAMWHLCCTTPPIKNSFTSLPEERSDSKPDVQSKCNSFVPSISCGSSLDSTILLTSSDSGTMDQFELRTNIAQAPDFYGFVKLMASKSKEQAPSIPTMIQLAELVFHDYQKYLLGNRKKNGFSRII